MTKSTAQGSQFKVTSSHGVCAPQRTSCYMSLTIVLVSKYFTFVLMFEYHDYFRFFILSVDISCRRSVTSI